jgi:two-component system nitrate/nitrite response regulator NarL
MKMPAIQIKLIIADDHLLFIQGLEMLLKSEEDITIEDVAFDGKELLDLLQQKAYDIVLLDINMPEMNGLDATKYIKRSFPLTKIIVLSTYDEDYLIEKAKQFGASGYQLKGCGKEELIRTIRLVFDGQTCFPFRKPKPESEFDERDNFLKQFKLTKREMEVIGLIGENNTNQNISEKLSLSIYTIDTHRKNIMQKLGFTKPSQLMKFIYEHGL